MSCSRMESRLLILENVTDGQFPWDKFSEVFPLAPEDECEDEFGDVFVKAFTLCKNREEKEHLLDMVGLQLFASLELYKRQRRWCQRPFINTPLFYKIVMIDRFQEAYGLTLINPAGLRKDPYDPLSYHRRLDRRNKIKLEEVYLTIVHSNIHISVVDLLRSELAFRPASRPTCEPTSKNEE